MVKFVRNHRLPAFAYVNVLHGLHMAVRQPFQRFDGGAALRLRLQGQPHVDLRCLQIIAHVAGSAPGQFRKNSVQGNGLSCQHCPHL
ncbi:MAG: hypothetical protein B7Y36_17355 [Novosphingobium sp. 28-62-57]|nr:MAG: hypothetical protein B7Y36_17355 [Novosphingobium sp. 28-62-57]